MILSPADSGIGENPEIATSSSDLSLYADEFHRRNDILRNSIDAENTDETVDIITDMANEIQDCKTGKISRLITDVFHFYFRAGLVWWRVPSVGREVSFIRWKNRRQVENSDSSLTPLLDYQRFKHRKELTQLMNVNRNAVSNPWLILQLIIEAGI